MDSLKKEAPPWAWVATTNRLIVQMKEKRKEGRQDCRLLPALPWTAVFCDSSLPCCPDLETANYGLKLYKR